MASLTIGKSLGLDYFKSMDFTFTLYLIFSLYSLPLAQSFFPLEGKG